MWSQQSPHGLRVSFSFGSFIFVCWLCRAPKPNKTVEATAGKFLVEFGVLRAVPHLCVRGRKFAAVSKHGFRVEPIRAAADDPLVDALHRESPAGVILHVGVWVVIGVSLDFPFHVFIADAHPHEQVSGAQPAISGLVAVSVSDIGFLRLSFLVGGWHTLNVVQIMKTPLIIDRWLQESEKRVTVFTLLAGIAAFGIGAAFLGPLNGLYLALGTFAAVGALDVFHTNTKARLKERQAPFIEPESELFFAAINQKGRHPKVIEEFPHGGLLFETRGFDEVPGGISLSFPFCPRCKNKVFERVCVRFPGRQQIVFHCSCGFSQPSQQTLSEVRTEARKACKILTFTPEP